ncbi:acyltransferase family protein [Rivibacter subsaxonicus]|uniref:Putative acyltransferase n=1 Tax=Rivibacter subsaxonicus TaxID=457575 RepID=A0A4Q7W0H0_9BURK|nr:heparan-alpha-glucosaminide N-acetyltransferase domain-containing protein [Rivibacter subsaxonicus]RZU02667.1 putative acyltransferase [Rivibacter subsaxonicus]
MKPDTASNLAPADAGAPTQGRRLLSLDAFRGFTIAAMLLVNDPGDWGHLHPPLAHARWDGWTFTDLVFPFFLFIVGVSMTLSLGQRAVQGGDRRTLVLKLWKRALTIIVIGLLLNLVQNFDLAGMRVPGVLQRIGLCILLAAPIVVYAGLRQQVAWILGLLAGYSLLMLLVPAPGADGVLRAGALQPGQDLGSYLDRLLLDGHLWSQSKTWDPEGLLGTLPALASTLLGVLAGRWLAGSAPPAEKTAWFFVAGIAALVLGMVLGLVLMPINKSLWTPSYALFMTGWALVYFGTFYWLLDGQPSAAWRATAARWFKPLVVFGMNALFLFALSALIATAGYTLKITRTDGSAVTLQQWLYAPIQALPIAPENASLLFALCFVSFMYLIAWGMWRKRWFVKV